MPAPHGLRLRAYAGKQRGQLPLVFFDEDVLFRVEDQYPVPQPGKFPRPQLRLSRLVIDELDRVKVLLLVRGIAGDVLQKARAVGALRLILVVETNSARMIQPSARFGDMGRLSSLGLIFSCTSFGKFFASSAVGIVTVTPQMPRNSRTQAAAESISVISIASFLPHAASPPRRRGCAPWQAVSIRPHSPRREKIAGSFPP